MGRSLPPFLIWRLLLLGWVGSLAMTATEATGQTLYGGLGLAGSTQPFGVGVGLRGYFQPGPHLRLAGFADGVLALAAPQTSYAVRGGMQVQGLLPLSQLTAYGFAGVAYRYHEYWVYLPPSSGLPELQHFVSLGPLVLSGFGVSHRQGKLGFAAEYELHYSLENEVLGWGHMISFYLIGPFRVKEMPTPP